jgi:hypothetical protein
VLLASQVNTIRAVPGFSKLDGRNCKQSTQVAWVFLRKMNWIRLLTRLCGNIVYLTFILGFLLDVYVLCLLPFFVLPHVINNCHITPSSIT